MIYFTFFGDCTPFHTTVNAACCGVGKARGVKGRGNTEPKWSRTDGSKRWRENDRENEIKQERERSREEGRKIHGVRAKRNK